MSEVQGYAYAAYPERAKLNRVLGEEGKARALEKRAEELFRLIQERLWLPELSTYALALDRHKEPLKVKASNAGHLLWAGAVPRGVLRELVETLFSEELRLRLAPRHSSLGRGTVPLWPTGGGK